MKPLVPDALWERLQPLLPPVPERRFRFPGRKPLDYRKILTGILFVLKTGIAWDDLPAELGCGGGKTCHSYRCPWHQAGVWQRWHAWRLAGRNGADAIDVLHTFTPDAVVVDLQLPVMDGRSFIELYRRRVRPAASIIVMSGRSDGRAIAQSVGAEGYVAKPVEVDDLLRALSLSLAVS